MSRCSLYRWFRSIVENSCPGEVSASSDLSHFVFSTEWNIFAPGGNLRPPGSVYDNNTGTGTVAVASLTPGGEPIPSEPSDHAGIRFRSPAYQTMARTSSSGAGASAPVGSLTAPSRIAEKPVGGKIHCPTYPLHLYMRVDDAITYDVSQGHDVKYVGMSADGSKVFFTSSEQLTSEDHDASVDLYMWSEAGEKEGNPLTLISKGTITRKPRRTGPERRVQRELHHP